jgi:hypothetical protein
MYTINFWPILVAAIVGFGVSALWYSPILFGKEWMALTKTTGEDVAAAQMRGVWKSYLIQFIALLVMFIVVGFCVSAIGITNASDGGFLGFLAWLGFMVPLFLAGLLWKREPFKLNLIDGINYLIILAIGAAIIGAWR